MRRPRRPTPIPLRLSLCTLVACAADSTRTSAFDDPSTSATEPDAATSTAVPPNDTDDDRPPQPTDGAPPKFDLAAVDTPPTDTRVCHVVDDLDAVGPCSAPAPSEGLEPVVEWSWDGPRGTYVSASPIVANLTDDDGNGSIDLCDVPDIVVVAGGSGSKGLGALWAFDGATGAEHFHVPQIDALVDPALGDIDGDGTVEIVAAMFEGFGSYGRRLVAFENDGTVAWQTTVTVGRYNLGFAIALADIDADGDVEIVAHDTVIDHEGQLVWVAEEAPRLAVDHTSATAVADLDGDGRSEIILGSTAYTADGAPYYAVPGLTQIGYPHIANLDDDPSPEVLVLTSDGATVLEHDGTIRLLNQRPTANYYHDWAVPTFVHDLDGDGVAEAALLSIEHYIAVDRDMSPTWTLPNHVIHGTGTAFDFYGDGRAEALVPSDETLSWADGAGEPALLIEHPEGSYNLTTDPIVVDADNDGSAEIVVVGHAPALRVIGDAGNRWVGARRIWNQHTYHVTNVREDGTIPQHESPSWASLNTYRVNARIDAAGVCTTPPAG